jgi:hypothetical protein
LAPSLSGVEDPLIVLRTIIVLNLSTNVLILSIISTAFRCPGISEFDAVKVDDALYLHLIGYFLGASV